MRLFIAIVLNDEIREELKEAQNAMRSQAVRGNYTKTENLHLTLAFIGDYGDPERVRDAIDGVQFRDFTIRLDGIGAFRDLWWAGIEENAELKALVKRLRRALADADIPFDRKKFSPHITLIRKARSAAEISPGMPAERLGRAVMKVERISLMRSDRTKSGMRYTEL